MRASGIALALLLVTSSSAWAQSAAPASLTGDPNAGKTLWQGEHCSFCHGNNGEGGFGPDLAGRVLTMAQFLKAVRQPWGVMPQFGESQLSDQELANMRAYLGTLPAPTALGKWHWPQPPAEAGAPLGQTLQISVGCAQCHEPELGVPRRQLGAVAKDATFEYFGNVVWEHNAKYPKGNMGNFSRERVSPPVLREIYNFMLALGLRVPMSTAITAAGANTYSVAISNTGVPGKGLDAEILTVQIPLPSGFTVAKTEGAGYKGIRKATARQFALDGSGKIKEWETDAIIFELPKLAAGEKATVGFTLAGSGAPAPTAFDGSLLLWEKPALRTGTPNLVYRDHRIPEVGDAAQIRSPRP